VAAEYRKIRNEPHDPTFSELRRIARKYPHPRPGYVPERIKHGTIKKAMDFVNKGSIEVKDGKGLIRPQYEATGMMPDDPEVGKKQTKVLKPKDSSKR